MSDSPPRWAATTAQIQTWDRGGGGRGFAPSGIGRGFAKWGLASDGRYTLVFNSVQSGMIADLHHFHGDREPDPSFHLIADTDALMMISVWILLLLSDANLRSLVYRLSKPTFSASMSQF
jgi:hypothetical protein